MAKASRWSRERKKAYFQCFTNCFLHSFKKLSKAMKQHFQNITSIALKL